MDPITAAVRGGQHQRLAVNVTEAAVVTGLGRDGVYDAIREGQLEARKYGRRTVITIEAIERFLRALPPLQLPPKEAA
jgi:excisionase family DNA binding protein